MKRVPNIPMGVVDVRDVADLHILNQKIRLLFANLEVSDKLLNKVK
ncbi:MAG: hypothetical protein ABIN24_03935 [Dyadobacter sp.]